MSAAEVALIVRRIGSDLDKELKKEIRKTFRQLEALQNLSAMLSADDVLPATREWAASPDLLLVLVDLVITERPSLVVECGSGVSTLWLALAMRRFGSTPDHRARSRSDLRRQDARVPGQAWRQRPRRGA
jgi:cephalosporin hydroxylase